MMSKNSPDISLRIFHSIEHYGLPITRAVFLSGASLAPYLVAFGTDLFLSACEEDVQSAVDAGIAAGIICHEPDDGYQRSGAPGQIRIAFDGDAVLFSDEAEQVYKEHGLEAFENSEKEKATQPLCAGTCWMTSASTVRLAHARYSHSMQQIAVISSGQLLSDRLSRYAPYSLLAGVGSVASYSSWPT